MQANNICTAAFCLSRACPKLSEELISLITAFLVIQSEHIEVDFNFQPVHSQLPWGKSDLAERLCKISYYRYNTFALRGHFKNPDCYRFKHNFLLDAQAENPPKFFSAAETIPTLPLNLVTSIKLLKIIDEDTGQPYSQDVVDPKYSPGWRNLIPKGSPVLAAFNGKGTCLAPHFDISELNHFKSLRTISITCVFPITFALKSKLHLVTHLDCLTVDCRWNPLLDIPSFTQDLSSNKVTMSRFTNYFFDNSISPSTPNNTVRFCIIVNRLRNRNIASLMNDDWMDDYFPDEIDDLEGKQCTWTELGITKAMKAWFRGLDDYEIPGRFGTSFQKSQWHFR